MKKRAYIILALLTAGFTFSMAKTPVVKKRQINQQQRIHQGVHSGELTRGEFIQLERQQIQIQRTKQRAKADDVVTLKEKAIIHHKQSKAKQNIYRKKHN